MFKTLTLAQGGVTVRYVPWATLKLQVALDELWSAYPLLIVMQPNGVNFGPAHTVRGYYMWRFVYAFGHTLSMEIDTTVAPWLGALKVWWEGDAQSGDYQRLYTTFQAVVPETFLVEWYDGYEATRDPIIAAPVEIQPGAEEAAASNPFLGSGELPPSSASTKESTTASDVKSSRKRRSKPS